MGQNFRGKFTVLNESFTCLNCGAKVEKSSSTCRNHCPFCLRSLHIDNYPGDREAECGAIMHPIGIKTKSGMKDVDILFKCSRCGLERYNRANLKDDIQPDSFESLLKLSSQNSI